MRVELLYFDGCPSREQLQPRLEELARAAGATDPVELRAVESDEVALRERFLGSPTVRVDGRDIEPGADLRNDFGLKCRLYRTGQGASGVPPDEWITAALSATTPGVGSGLRAGGGRSARADLDELAVAIRAARPRFDAEEQRVALALYRLLAAGVPVSASALAARTGTPVARVAELLGAWPEVFRDDERHVVAFGGLSLEPSTHRFVVDSRQLYTWCAWDALFLPELLGRTAAVSSECPTTGDVIELTVKPGGVDRLVPSGAVLSMRAPTDCCVGDDLSASFCQHVHFFASRDAAERWLAERADGFVLSIEEGFELGRLANHAHFRDTVLG